MLIAKILILMLIFTVSGFFIGYNVAKRRLVQQAQGSLHIVSSEDEPQPYIFLDLKSDQILNDGNFAFIQIIRSKS